MLAANNGQCDYQMHGISTDLNSGDEGHTDIHSGCESAVAHNCAHLHKKLGTTEGLPHWKHCNQMLQSDISIYQPQLRPSDWMLLAATQFRFLTHDPA